MKFSAMEKTYTFYTTNNSGKKEFFRKITVTAEKPRNCFKQAISSLKGKARDIADFLHIRGNHLYFWNDKVSWETS